MRVIGVVDLARGAAVHARGGVRERYRPVEVPGGTRGDADALARFYRRTGIQELYIADLDAIGGAAPQFDVMAGLARQCRQTWVDAAIASPSQAAAVLRTGSVTAVIGLETLSSATTLHELGQSTIAGTLAFSLDLRNAVPMSRCRGLAEMAPEDIARWAAGAGFATIIVVDVARVGLAASPDWDLLTRVRAAVPAVSLIVGGGMQNARDLHAAAGLGCQGVLAASALLDGRITASDVHGISRRSTAR